MILNIIRFLLLVLLIVSIIIDMEIPPVLSIQVNQLLIAIFIIFIIVVVDEIIGFLLGLIFLIIYFKHYQKIINSSNGSSASNLRNELNEPLIKAYNPFNLTNIDKFSDDIKPPQNKKTETISNEPSLNQINNCIVAPYISMELLDKAQNNIYDNKNYYTEIRNGENVYGVQGLNSDKLHFNAYEKTDVINSYPLNP